MHQLRSVRVSQIQVLQLYVLCSAEGCSLYIQQSKEKLASTAFHLSVEQLL